MELWGTLAPLIIGSAIVPIQTIITILLLQTPRGVLTALAWVAGMSTVKVLQGVLFGFVFGSPAVDPNTAETSSSVAVSVLLLVVAIIFFVTAFKQLFARSDPDAPPPRWMSMIESLTPIKAFLIGMGVMVIGAKFWVFTLGAVGAISDAALGVPLAVTTFLAFVVLTQTVNLAAIAVALFAPSRSEVVLGAASAWLSAHNRVIVIALGLVFGTWFLIKSMIGLGVL